MTGRYVRTAVDGSTIAEFHYVVERVWERPIDYWLRSGIGLAPLAMLTDEAAADLDFALERFQDSLAGQDTDETITKTLVGSSYVLCGMRYDRARITETYRRLSMLLEDSTTYQEILEKGLSKGRSQGERNLLLHLGTKKFGPPSAAIAAALQAIAEPARIEQLAERLLDAVDWEDLMRGV
jgi:hypothetical protein